MRAVVGITAMICLTAWAQAQAAEPQAESQPAATAPQPAQDANPAKAAPTPPDLQPGVKTPAPSAVATDKRKTKLFTPGEKYLLRQGYKLEVRDGTRYFCRNEDTLGTRLRDHKVCGTEEQISHRAEANNDTVRENLKRGMIHSDGR